MQKHTVFICISVYFFSFYPEPSVPFTPGMSLAWPVLHSVVDNEVTSKFCLFILSVFQLPDGLPRWTL